MQPHDTTPRLCSIPDCETPVKARGWCKLHYERWQRRGDPLAIGGPPRRKSSTDRFWLRVNKDGPVPAHCPELGQCWEWTAGRRSGYGRFAVNGVMVTATRYSYELHFGSIPDGLWVLHRCDNPPCVRPDHLFAGTPTENLLDMMAKGRRIYPTKTHCVHGHEFTPENSMAYIGKRGRACRTCFNERRAVPCKQCGAPRVGNVGTGLCQKCYFDARFPQRLTLHKPK